VKVDAEDVRVGAERVAARRQREGVAQPHQHAMLAPHVVRGRSDRAQRRPPEHILGVAEPQQVGQVGVPATELLQREGTCRVR